MAVGQYLRRWFAGPAEDESSDGALLGRFVSRQDETAFGMLLERHGPMVMRVCRQVLQHSDDAEDAFQAAFLVLAQQARSIRRSESLPGWLYRVAYHIAVQQRGRAANRQMHEKQLAAIMNRQHHLPPGLEEHFPVIHEEINRLPARYRVPTVLCYLQGLSNEAAAEQLKCPVGTVKTRLNRARTLLRDRLARRGVALTSVLLGGLLAEGTASAAVPATLTASTLKAATLVAAGQSAPVSANVLALTEGAQALFVGPMKLAGAIVASVGVAAALSVGAIAYSSLPGQPAAEQRQQPVVAQAAPQNSVDASIVAEPPAVQVNPPPGQTGPATFPSEVTVYPAPAASNAEASVGSRRDARTSQQLDSRAEQYRRHQAQASELQNSEPELGPMPTLVRPKSAGPVWWDFMWVPW